MRRQVKIFLLHFQFVLQYRARNFIWFLQSFINPFILMLFWRGAVGKRATIAGWDVVQIQSYYLLMIVAQVFLMHSVDYVVSRKDIKDGDLTNYLLKPYSYLAYCIQSETPWRLIQGFYGLVAILILPLLMQFSIRITHDPLIIGASIVIAFLAYFISFFFKMITGFLAFWIVDVHAVREMQEILVLLFSGVLMPFTFMPHWIQTAAHLTPFPYMIYYPITVLLGSYDSSMILKIMGDQVLWLGALILIYRFMWTKGLQSFTGVGR